MSDDLSDPVGLAEFVAVPRGATPDPAKRVRTPTPRPRLSDRLTSIKDFVKKLKNYTLRWTSTPDPEIMSYDDFTDEHRRHIKIVSGTLYRHKTLQLSYTTYDMQEDQDRIYQRRYPDVMVLSDDEEHPYLYGRVLDFFHVNVKNDSPSTLLSAENDTAILQMAWVRWFKLNRPEGPSGFCSLRYPSVSFYEGHEPDAFGFIHPDEIIRAVHLIPAFKHGRTEELLGTPSLGRPEGENDDWRVFHVNMCVLQQLPHFLQHLVCSPLSVGLVRLAGRDMFMRFRGGGIGHVYMRQVEPWLDATGWGTTWPSLSDREPDPTGLTPTSEGERASEGGGDTMIDDSEGSASEGDDEDEDVDGEDPEQPEEDADGDEDEDEENGQNPIGHNHVSEDGEPDGNDVEDEVGARMVDTGL